MTAPNVSVGGLVLSVGGNLLGLIAALTGGAIWPIGLLMLLNAVHFALIARALCTRDRARQQMPTDQAGEGV